MPDPQTSVLIQISGDGRVLGAPAGRTLAAVGQAATLRCGLEGWAGDRPLLADRCYGEYDPAKELVLRAVAAEGYKFAGWSGACAGKGLTCRVAARKLHSVTARFAPRRPAAVATALQRPLLNVRWVRSNGTGLLVVRGWVSGAAKGRIDVRRPAAGPLLTKRLRLNGGRFQTLATMRSGKLAGGAMLLPGGFTVALSGRRGDARLPLQVRTIEIGSPPEGVVRRAFPSARENGRTVLRLAAKTQVAWANFRFESQPRLGKRLTVRWFHRDGRTVLGEVVKPNRPTVSSYLELRTPTGIPDGLYTAELRVGGKIVKRLAVRVGGAPARR